MTNKDLFYDVTMFHLKGGHPVGDAQFTDAEFLKNRISFIEEELTELKAACIEESHAAEALDALVDIMYFCIGTAVALGWDINEAWNRVQKSNMDKFPEGVAIRHSETNKILKPAGWVAPVLNDLVAHNK